ncbi:hypothetical protein B4Q13_18385, partial [Lacticaseibacillus rhamnosus]
MADLVAAAFSFCFDGVASRANEQRRNNRLSALDPRLRRTGIRLIAATLAMAALLYFVLNPLVDPWTGKGLVERSVALAVLIGVGVT